MRDEPVILLYAVWCRLVAGGGGDRRCKVLIVGDVGLELEGKELSFER